MAKKDYDWEKGVILEEHTRKKHQILTDYFREYLATRCQIPFQTTFKLIVVDGFSGGGRYKCGSPGSPAIFVEVLISSIKDINFKRIEKGLKPIKIECYLFLNDANPKVVKILKQTMTPLLLQANSENPNLEIKEFYSSEKFESAYYEIKSKLKTIKCPNIFFNLDQCGYTHVTTDVIRDITRSWKSAEVILTFMIKGLLTFLSQDPKKSNVTLDKSVRDEIDQIIKNDGIISDKAWLGRAEVILFNHLQSCANFVSPFSINNPGGWRYWLMHFANSYRAREVYNDVLHANSESQAHFGRLGLKMLSYDPRDDFSKSLYLFNDDSRQASKESLHLDIPAHLSNAGNIMLASEFFEATYNETPAHSDDIKKVFIENPDIEVVTKNGGVRRVHGTIRPDDKIKLTYQRSIFLPS